MMTLTLPYPPCLNNLYATVRGRRVLSAKGRAYKQTASALALKSGCKPVSGDVSISFDVYRPRRIGDLDGTLKATLDSLTGVAWQDDSQITEIHAYRHDDKRDPRVVMTIRPA